MRARIAAERSVESANNAAERACSGLAKVTQPFDELRRADGPAVRGAGDGVSAAIIKRVVRH